MKKTDDIEQQAPQQPQPESGLTNLDNPAWLPWTDHARLCRSIILAPGLLQSFKNTREKDEPKLNVSVKIEDTLMELRAPSAWKGYSVKLLATVSALTGRNGIMLTPSPGSEIGKVTRNLLDPSHVFDTKAIYVMTTPTALLKEMGLSKGKYQYTALTRGLRQLAETTIWLKKGKEDVCTHLLSYKKDETEGRDRLCVALHPILANAILGKPYVRIDMNEMRSIKHDAAIILYTRLCALIDCPTGKMTAQKGSLKGKGKTVTVNDGQNNSRLFKFETLMGYVWPTSANNKSTVRTRRLTLRKALEELAGLPHWTVDEYVKNSFKITRHHALV